MSQLKSWLRSMCKSVLSKQGGFSIMLGPDITPQEGAELFRAIADYIDSTGKFPFPPGNDRAAQAEPQSTESPK